MKPDIPTPNRLMPPPLIIGHGPCAQRVQRILSDNGIHSEMVPSEAVVRKAGSVGDFTLSIRENGPPRTMKAGAVVIAEPDRRLSRLDAWSLTPSTGTLTPSTRSLTPSTGSEAPFAGAYSLSEVAADEARRSRGADPEAAPSAFDPEAAPSAFDPEAAPSAADPEAAPSAAVAMLCGFHGTNHPAVFRQAMALAAALAKSGHRKIFAITEHLKLTASGAMAAYRRSREAGVIFLKLNSGPPAVNTEGGRVRIRFTDPVSGAPCELWPDLTIVDEAAAGASDLIRLARILGLETDEDGYIRTLNVRRGPVETRFPGVLAAGPSRRPGEPEEDEADADLAAAAVLSLYRRHPMEPPLRPMEPPLHLMEPPLRPMEPPLHPPEDTVAPTRHVARITDGLCARCLTCLRLCPHGAILWTGMGVVVAEWACAGCGICAAQCPAEAISLADAPLPMRTAPVGESIFWTGTGAADGAETAVGAWTADGTGAAAKAGAGDGSDADSASADIVVFRCRKSAALAADAARSMGLAPPPGVTFLDLPCGGSLSDTVILKALESGARGVLALACHAGNCQSETGHRHAAEAVDRARRLLTTLNQNPEVTARRVAFCSLAANMPVEYDRAIRDFIYNLDRDRIDKGEC